MNYPVGDFLIRLKNAYKANRKQLVSPSSKFREAVAQLLKKHGYIADYVSEGEVKKTLTLHLVYNNRQPKVTDVKLFSKPGRRLYQTSSALPWGQTPSSLIIVSTSKGLLSQKEAAAQKIGGEIIAEIY
jgi:small subunit ribosomal protein S8